AARLEPEARELDAVPRGDERAARRDLDIRRRAELAPLAPLVLHDGGDAYSANDREEVEREAAGTVGADRDSAAHSSEPADGSAAMRDGEERVEVVILKARLGSGGPAPRDGEERARAAALP